MRTRSPFKIHGGKFYISSFVIEHFPENYTEYDYVEPFCGAGSVFFNKLPANSPHYEVIADVDDGVIAIYKTLRDEPETFINKLKKIEYCEKVFEKAKEKTEFEGNLDRAINEFILRRMSRGGMKDAFAWSDRKRGGKPGDVNAWETIMEILPALSNRLKNIHILKENFLNTTDAFNGKNTLMYCDPPYFQSTRTSPNVYQYEMTEEDHHKLSQQLNKFQGKVILSGYNSKQYDEWYSRWRKVEKVVANHSSQAKKKEKRTEVLWLNY